MNDDDLKKKKRLSQDEEDMINALKYSKEKRLKLEQEQYLATRHSDSITDPAIRYRDSRLEMYIFKLGYVYDVNLQKVAKLLNISQQTLYVTVGDPVRNIGTPDDMGGFAYSDNIFALFPQVRNGTIRVGITSSPIQNNFFSRVKGNNSVIISLSQCDELCQRAGKTKEEYIAQGIVTRLLWLLFRDTFPDKDIYHDDTRGCIFDFCAQKQEKIYKLKASMIDAVCRGKLAEANIPESMIHTVEKILGRIRKPSFGDVFQISLQKPWFSFIVSGLLFGTLINVMSSLILGEFDSVCDILISSSLFIVAIALVVANYLRTVKNLEKESPD